MNKTRDNPLLLTMLPFGEMIDMSGGLSIVDWAQKKTSMCLRNPTESNIHLQKCRFNMI